MSLTANQLSTLKAAILADPVLSSQPMNSDGAVAIADAFNIAAVPTFTVWKSNVTINDTGKQFVGTEWAGMTGANHTRLQTVDQWLAGGYNAALPDIRAMFDDIWSGAGGAGTRARLLALWKRTATRGEKLYATGTGSDASPATLVVEGNIGYQDVVAARALA